MTDEIKARIRWVNLYLETENASLVCRCCGISKPTLRLWVCGYQKYGIQGLRSINKGPAKTLEKKVTSQIEQWVLALRKRRLSSRRIQSERIRLEGCSLSKRTIQGVLDKNQQSSLKTNRRIRKTIKRHIREVPGEGVQMEICKITKQLYQYPQLAIAHRQKYTRSLLFH
jgi:hypothetical protein